jgi:hypothetical protein
MSLLSNVLVFVCVAAGLGLFFNAYYKGKKALKKIQDKNRPKSWPAE